MITPQTKAQKLASAIGLNTDLYLKREDLHPYGSHKGRSIPVMIEFYIKEGWKDFCISSSGNAALAAIYTIKDLNQKSGNQNTLHVFVGNHIKPEKLERLEQTKANDENITIEKVNNPKQSAFIMNKESKAKNLRQSTDDNALIGYQTLADQLSQIQNLTAVFIPTSSGTTAQGLYEGFRKNNLNPQIHIVQTPKCHPLVDSVIARSRSDAAIPSLILPKHGIASADIIGVAMTEKNSIANAIVDTVGYRKEAIQKILQETAGKGWIAEDKDIIDSQKQIKETEGLEISPNSALSIAGLNLALKAGWKFEGAVVCLITGL